MDGNFRGGGEDITGVYWLGAFIGVGLGHMGIGNDPFDICRYTGLMGCHRTVAITDNKTTALFTAERHKNENTQKITVSGERMRKVALEPEW